MWYFELFQLELDGLLAFFSGILMDFLHFLILILMTLHFFGKKGTFLSFNLNWKIFLGGGFCKYGFSIWKGGEAPPPGRLEAGHRARKRGPTGGGPTPGPLSMAAQAGPGAEPWEGAPPGAPLWGAPSGEKGKIFKGKLVGPGRGAFFPVGGAPLGGPPIRQLTPRPRVEGALWMAPIKWGSLAPQKDLFGLSFFRVFCKKNFSNGKNFSTENPSRGVPKPFIWDLFWRERRKGITSSQKKCKVTMIRNFWVLMEFL